MNASDRKDAYIGEEKALSGRSIQPLVTTITCFEGRHRAPLFFFVSVDILSYMQHLEVSFVEQQKARLQQELERVTLDLGKVSDKVGARYEDLGDDEESNAQEVAQFEESVDATKQLRSLRDDLEAALKRIEVGNYGICEQCKESISQERLEAVPSARTCMACGGEQAS